MDLCFVFILKELLSFSGQYSGLLKTILEDAEFGCW